MVQRPHQGLASVPDHERTFGPWRPSREQVERDTDQFVEEMFPLGWRERLARKQSNPCFDLSSVSTENDAIPVIAGGIAANRGPAELAQAPLLRGILAVGVPMELAVSASAQASTAPELQEARRRTGDLAFGVAVGFALRSQLVERGDVDG